MILVNVLDIFTVIPHLFFTATLGDRWWWYHFLKKNQGRFRMCSITLGEIGKDRDGQRKHCIESEACIETARSARRG